MINVRSLIHCLLATSSLIFMCQAKASIDVYQFSDETKREQYLEVIRELRCPKCQNQDIADSNAPIAKDMRREVHRLVEEGESPDDIMSFMIERFGDFVSYRPKVAPVTYALWYGPFVLIALGLLVILGLASRKKAKAEPQESALSEEEHKRAQSLLGEDVNKDAGQGKGK